MTAWIILLGTMGIVTTRSLGFVMDRSKIGNSGPAIWPEPSWDNDRRSSIDLLLNGRIYSADLDNILRDTETKKSTIDENEKCSSSSSADDTPQRLKRSENILVNESRSTSGETNVPESNVSESNVSQSNVFESNVSESNVSESNESTVESASSSDTERSVIKSAKTSDSEAPRNIVLLLVDDGANDRETTWKNFETSHKFNVQGFLRNCPVGELDDNSKFSSNESIVSERTNENCECERFMRSNIGTLLSWARHVKEINIATVSSTNFTISSPFGSEGSLIEVKDLEDNDETNVPRQDVPRSWTDIRNTRRMIDLDEKSAPFVSSMPVASPIKQDGINGYDGMWNVFDMFSRIRIAFFRILLESLGNLGAPAEESPGKRLYSVQPSVVELVNDAIKDLKSVSNDKGFVLVAVTPSNELSATIDVLQREIAARETLLIVAGICSKINEPIPFFADGPGDENLHKARTIWDLPGFIRSAVSNGCPNEVCTSERRPEPMPLLPRKRVVRAKDEDETTDLTTEEKAMKVVDDVEENKTTPTIGKRSGSGVGKLRVDGVAAILGIVTSVTAMLALNS